MRKPKPCELYRHFDKDGRLLYVGISHTTIERLMQHKAASSWFDQIVRVEIERFPSRAEALAAEEAAIKTEKPVNNINYGTFPGQRKIDEPEKLRLISRAKEFGIIFNKNACLSSMQHAIKAIERGNYEEAKSSFAWSVLNSRLIDKSKKMEHS